MNQITLTRYLYDKDRVIISLYDSIERRNYEESLFWAYEIYYSGCHKGIIDELVKIYEVRFAKNHRKLGLYIEKKRGILGDQPGLVATIIKNLTMKNPDIPETANVKFVNVKEYHVKSYETREPDGMPPWKFLKEVCKYGVVSKNHKGDVYDNAFRGNWLLYASRSPIWAERIRLYDGRVEDGEVAFLDEDKEEEFYNRFGYEPDEQSTEIQGKCLGSVNKI